MLLCTFFKRIQYEIDKIQYNGDVVTELANKGYAIKDRSPYYRNACVNIAEHLENIEMILNELYKEVVNGYRPVIKKEDGSARANRNVKLPFWLEKIVERRMQLLIDTKPYLKAIITSNRYIITLSINKYINTNFMRITNRWYDLHTICEKTMAEDVLYGWLHTLIDDVINYVSIKYAFDRVQYHATSNADTTNIDNVYNNSIKRLKPPSIQTYINTFNALENSVLNNIYSDSITVQDNLNAVTSSTLTEASLLKHYNLLLKEIKEIPKVKKEDEASTVTNK